MNSNDRLPEARLWHASTRPLGIWWCDRTDGNHWRSFWGLKARNHHFFQYFGVSACPPVVLVINVLFVIALQIDVGTMASLPQEIKLG